MNSDRLDQDLAHLNTIFTGADWELMNMDVDALTDKYPVVLSPDSTPDPNNGVWRERICIRIPHWVLSELRGQAKHLGIPYQTHLNNLLAAQISTGGGTP